MRPRIDDRGLMDHSERGICCRIAEHRPRRGVAMRDLRSTYRVPATAGFYAITTDGNGIRNAGPVLDICGYGFSMERVGGPMLCGARVEVELCVRGSALPILTEARVRHQEDRRCGLAFRDPTEVWMQLRASQWPLFNRRRDERIEAEGMREATALLVRGPNAAYPRAAELNDLSTSGVGFQLEGGEFEKGDELTLSLWTTEQTSLAAVVRSVQWAETAVRYGAEFIDISPRMGLAVA